MLLMDISASTGLGNNADYPYVAPDKMYSSKAPQNYCFFFCQPNVTNELFAETIKFYGRS